MGESRKYQLLLLPVTEHFHPSTLLPYSKDLNKEALLFRDPDIDSHLIPQESAAVFDRSSAASILVQSSSASTLTFHTQRSLSTKCGVAIECVSLSLVFLDAASAVSPVRGCKRPRGPRREAKRDVH